MVFFTCNACGESLKKASVEKHYLTKCRACEVLSCIDCGKDFYGDAYKEHTSCISEDQKYGGKNFQAAPQKGVIKQSSWMETVREASRNPSLKPTVRDALKHIVDAGYDNIPRKKAKFVNFLSNSLRIRGDWLVNEIWNVIDRQASAQKAAAAQASDKDSSGPEKVTVEPDKKVTNGETETKKEKRKKEIRTLGDALGKENNVALDNGRKRKRQGDPIETEQLTAEDVEEQDSQPKKKKKKKKRDAVDQAADIGGGEGRVVKFDGAENIDNTISEGGQNKSQKKKKSKRKVGGEDLSHGDRLSGVPDEEAEERENGDVSMNDSEKHLPIKKFPWEAVITEVLQNAGGEIRLKKLKKKVLTEFMSRGGDPSLSTEEKVMAKFNKKVLKNPKFKVYKEMVHLKS